MERIRPANLSKWIKERRELDMLSAMRAETAGDLKPMKELKVRLSVLNANILRGAVSLSGRPPSLRKPSVRKDDK